MIQSDEIFLIQAINKINKKEVSYQLIGNATYFSINKPLIICLSSNKGDHIFKLRSTKKLYLSTVYEFKFKTTIN